MASIRQPESIGAITRASATTASLAASRINIGGQQYVTTTALALNTATVGVGGVDATLVASKVYYVYAVLSSGSLALIASQASTLPSGFTQARVVGYFYSNASLQIQWANKTPEVITTQLTSGSSNFVPQSTTAYMRIRMVGGGAGGGSGGNGVGGQGTTTTFGTSFLIANQGFANSYGFVATGGGASSAPSGVSYFLCIPGAYGAGGGALSSGANFSGGAGGATPFGGAGAGGANTASGVAASANTGSGGGGSGTGSTTWSGTGGGAGAYVEAEVMGPLASSYSYVVGPGGAGSAVSPAGGAGASGIIIIDEFYI